MAVRTKGSKKGTVADDALILADRTAETYRKYATMASVRQPLFAGLGTVIDHDATTAEMLHAAELDNWNVRLEEVALPGRSDVSYFATVRDNPTDNLPDVLGMVGERYKVLQNEELFDFGDALLHGGHWETAGSFRQGRVVFGCLKVDRETFIDPNGANDQIADYLVVSTSHDGSVAIVAANTPIRVWCQNTLNISIKQAKQTWKIRHTATLEGRMQAAREALNLNSIYMDEFSKMANEMIATELTRDAVDAIFREVYPEPEKDVKGSLKKWETKIDTLWGIYNGDTLANLDGNNAWKVYNALTEQIDWFRNPRNGNSESVLAAGAGFDNATNNRKDGLLVKVNALAHDRRLVTV